MITQQGMLNHLVVGVDGSDGGRRAIDWAVAQAARGRVHAVHALPPFEELLAAALQVSSDPVRAEHQRLLQEEWSVVATGHSTEVRTELIEDSPARAPLGPCSAPRLATAAPRSWSDIRATKGGRTVTSATSPAASSTWPTSR